jgi:hypothetical protein
MKSDGSTARYYELPAGATELQHLISYRNMNAQVGEAFRSLYRYGQAEHSDKLRDAKKVLFYMQAEVERLEKYEATPPSPPTPDQS